MNLTQLICIKPNNPKSIDGRSSVFSSKNFILLVVLCFTIVMQLALEGRAKSQTQFAQSFSCSKPKTCGRMRSCKEAYFYLTQCGDRARDGDSDGIPCEKLCGKTLQQMRERLNS